jgi:hypothetical protein
MISDTLFEFMNNEFVELLDVNPIYEAYKEEIEALKARMFALQLYLDLNPNDADLDGLRAVLFGEWEVRELNPETKTMSSGHEAQIRIHKAIAKYATADRDQEAMRIAFTILDLLMDDEIHERESTKEEAQGTTRLEDAQSDLIEGGCADVNSAVQFLREYFPENIKGLNDEQLQRVAQMMDISW